MSALDEIRRQIEAVEVAARNPRQIRVTRLAPPGAIYDVPYSESAEDDPAALLTSADRELLINPETWERITTEIAPSRVVRAGTAVLFGIPVVNG